MYGAKKLFLSIIPVIVGICTMLVLDSQLGNITQEEFLKIFQNRWLRVITLFGAAYAANGQSATLALAAVVIYIFLLAGTGNEGTSQFDRPKNIISPSSASMVYTNMAADAKIKSSDQTDPASFHDLR